MHQHNTAPLHASQPQDLAFSDGIFRRQKLKQPLPTLPALNIR